MERKIKKKILKEGISKANSGEIYKETFKAYLLGKNSEKKNVWVHKIFLRGTLDKKNVEKALKKFQMGTLERKINETFTQT